MHRIFHYSENESCTCYLFLKVGHKLAKVTFMWHLSSHFLCLETHSLWHRSYWPSSQLLTFTGTSKSLARPAVYVWRSLCPWQDSNKIEDGRYVQLALSSLQQSLHFLHPQIQVAFRTSFHGPRVTMLQQTDLNVSQRAAI